MKKLLKILLVIFCCIIGLISAGLYALDRAFSDMCGNEIFQEALAPDGRFKAVLFQRDCGATTNFSTQISLISPNEELPNEGGNIFIVNGRPEDTNIEISWLGPENLLIRHAAELADNNKEKFYKGITISYE